MEVCRLFMKQGETFIWEELTVNLLSNRPKVKKYCFLNHDTSK
jgi:hypothetical protein